MDSLKPQSNCKHFRALARNGDMVGTMYCPDCKKIVQVNIPFNNLMAEMRRIIRVYEAAKAKKTTIKVPRTKQLVNKRGVIKSAIVKPQANAGKENSRAGNRETKKNRK